MKTTTYTRDQMILSDGELYIIDREKRAYQSHTKEFRLRDGKTYRFDQKEDMGFAIIVSTVYEPGIPQLDRKHFVKPVELETLADKWSKFIGSNGRSKLADLRMHYRLGFTSGYNAKKAEFTLAQARTIWAAGVEASGTFEDALKLVRPLSIPISITVDDEFNVISVQWERQSENKNIDIQEPDIHNVLYMGDFLSVPTANPNLTEDDYKQFLVRDWVNISPEKPKL